MAKDSSSLLLLATIAIGLLALAGVWSSGSDHHQLISADKAEAYEMFE